VVTTFLLDGKITPRQRAIVLLLQRDLSDRDIALEMGLRPQTVKTYMKDLRRRTGLKRCGLAIAGYLLAQKEAECPRKQP
jgi:DNA-binding CsgD family transcriptional regulator